MVTSTKSQSLPSVIEEFQRIDPLLRVLSKELLGAHRLFCGFFRTSPDKVDISFVPLAKIICSVQCVPYVHQQEIIALEVGEESEEEN